MEQQERKNRSFIGLLLVFALLVYAAGVVAYFAARIVINDPQPWLALLHNGAPYYLAGAVVGLVLTVILRAPRLTAAYLLILVVGLVWLGVRLASPLTLPEPAGTPLTVVTFNTYPSNARYDEAVTWLLRQNADLLILQEVNADMSALDNAYEFVAEQQTETRQLVYSRYPILENEQIALADAAPQRVVLDVGGTAVAVYNLHLAMPFAPGDGPLLSRYDESLRNAQIIQVLSALSTESLPHIVAGDFNTSEWSLIYDTIDAQLNDAYRAVSWGIGATWPGGASEGLGAGLPRLFRLDYIWYSDAFQAVSSIVGPSLGSDHLPVKATLDLMPLS